MDDFINEMSYEEYEDSYYNYVNWYDATASVLNEMEIEAEVYED